MIYVGPKISIDGLRDVMVMSVYRQGKPPAGQIERDIPGMATCTNTDLVGKAVAIAAMVDRAKGFRLNAAMLASYDPEKQRWEQQASSLDDDVCQACTELRRMVIGA